MELKEIVKFFRKFKTKVLMYTILFGILGAVSYFLIPTLYIATGSLFVGRTVQSSPNDFFTYEGYYGQQSALSYTSSVVGLIENEDVAAQVLTETDSQINNTELRKYFRKVQVKKIGPQVITISVKEKTASKAQEVWQAIAKTTISITSKLNEKGDRALDVQKISANPIVTQMYTNIVINIAAGLLFGFLSATAILSLKEYLK